jgi:hypothetical protein
MIAVAMHRREASSTRAEPTGTVESPFEADD